MKWNNQWKLAAFAACVLLTASCKKDNNKSGTINGPQAALGNGTMHSFLEKDSHGNPVSLGIRFSASSLNGLSTDGSKEWMYPLELPQEAKVTGLDHLEVDWNPWGHEPQGIYTFPHFDFHFYRVTKDEQAKVTPGPDNTPVPAMYQPKDYESGVIAVPDMGVHWVDSLAPEFHGTKFTSTFIYGFYQGHLTFMEPMATLEWLNTKPAFDANIKQPQAFEKAGYYPIAIHYSYDSQAGEYTVSLNNLVWHDAGK